MLSKSKGVTCPWSMHDGHTLGQWLQPVPRATASRYQAFLVLHWLWLPHQVLFVAMCATALQ